MTLNGDERERVDRLDEGPNVEKERRANLVT